LIHSKYRNYLLPSSWVRLLENYCFILFDYEKGIVLQKEKDKEEIIINYINIENKPQETIYYDLIFLK
jgi:hypothetical protein